LSLYFLVTIVGILGGVFMLVVIFSLLSMAQMEDPYLDQMGLGEAGDWLENPKIWVEESPDIEPLRTAGCSHGPQVY
jgi:hypothetical protein